MVDILHSDFSQIYGYENSGEKVYIELYGYYNVTEFTITCEIPHDVSLTYRDIWQLLIDAWNDYHFPSYPIQPVFTIDFTNYPTTVLTAPGSIIDILSIEIFVDINNPRSLELPRILGFSEEMLDSTTSVKIDWDGNTSIMPFMGSARLQTTIDIKAFSDNTLSNSRLADWTSVETPNSQVTDISRTSVSNSQYHKKRGMKLKVINVPDKYIFNYDLFVDFAGRGDIELEFSFDLFSDETTLANLWGSESGSAKVRYSQYNLWEFDLCLIPKSRLK